MPITPLVLEADLTSGTIRFTDPAALVALVSSARSILNWKREDIYGIWPSPVTAGDVQIFDALANITLPSD